jgi:hypothetical protein
MAGRFLNYTLINVYGPTEDSDEEAKENDVQSCLLGCTAV